MKTTLKNTLGYDLYQVVRKHTLTRLSHRSQAVLCAQFIKQIEDKLIEYEKSALPDLYGDENTPWIVADIEARMNAFYEEEEATDLADPIIIAQPMVVEQSPTPKYLLEFQAKDSFKQEEEQLDAELVELDPEAAALSHSFTYERLIRSGWTYEGLFRAGGGMGCHAYHEFMHPVWGRLSFEARVSHMADGTQEWVDEQREAPYREFENWFLMLDGHDYGGQVLAGDSLDQLDEVLAYWSSIPEVCR